MKRRKTSLAKKILLAIVILLVLAIAGGYLILKFYIKPKTDNVVQSLLADEELRALLDDYAQNHTLDSDTTPGQTGANNAESDNPTTAPVSAATTTTEETPLKPDNIVTATQPTPPPEYQRPEQTKKPQPAGNSSTDKMASAKAQVSAKDWADGMALVGKVDVGYIMGLMSGGLTSEEKKELKAYLTSRLSSGEISRALELYNKYSHLL